MVGEMVVIWGCVWVWWPFPPAGLISHWVYLNRGCLPSAYRLSHTQTHTCAHSRTLAHTHIRQSKMLWSEGLRAHRVVIHSHCASLPVLHHSLSSHVLRCCDIHTGPCQSFLAVWWSCNHLMCQVYEGCGPRENRLPFWVFPSISCSTQTLLCSLNCSPQAS